MPSSIRSLRLADGLKLVGNLWQADPRGVVVLLRGGGQTRHSWFQTGRRLGAIGWSAPCMDVRARGVVLVDIVPRVEPVGAKRITDFMTGNPDDFSSLREVADDVGSGEAAAGERAGTAQADGIVE